MGTIASGGSIRAASNEQELAARGKIPKKGKTGRPAFCDKVVQSQPFDTYGHGGGVDCKSDDSDGRKAREFNMPVLEPPILEHQSHRQCVSEQ